MMMTKDKIKNLKSQCCHAPVMLATEMNKHPVETRYFYLCEGCESKCELKFPAKPHPMIRFLLTYGLALMITIVLLLGFYFITEYVVYEEEEISYTDLT